MPPRVSMLAVLVPLAACTPSTSSSTSLPSPNVTSGPVVRVTDQLLRDVLRDTADAAQRQLPGTGYRPLDRAARNATRETRRSVERVVLGR